MIRLLFSPFLNPQTRIPVNHAIIPLLNPPVQNYLFPPQIHQHQLNPQFHLEKRPELIHKLLHKLIHQPTQTLLKYPNQPLSQFVILYLFLFALLYLWKIELWCIHHLSNVRLNRIRFLLVALTLFFRLQLWQQFKLICFGVKNILTVCILGYVLLVILHFYLLQHR